MTWCSKVKSGDELVIGGGLIVRFDRDVFVKADSVEGEPLVTIEKRTGTAPSSGRAVAGTAADRGRV